MLKRLLRLLTGVAIGILVLVGIIFILTLVLADHEALFDGKPILAWAGQYAKGDSASSNRVVALLNSEIIPSLTETMLHDTNDSRIRLKLIEILNTLPGVSISFITAEGRRASAAMELGLFGPAGKDAIPVLMRAVKGSDPAVRGPAAEALGDIHGQPELVIPLLISCLDDDDLNDEAAGALGKFGELAKAAVPQLIPMLKLPDKDANEAARTALKKIDPEAAAKAGVN